MINNRERDSVQYEMCQRLYQENKLMIYRSRVLRYCTPRSPNKAVRHRPKETDNPLLKEQLGYFGADAAMHQPSETDYKTKEDRKKVLMNVMDQPYSKWQTLDQKDILMRTFKAISRAERAAAKGKPLSDLEMEADSLDSMWQRAFGVILKAKFHVELEAWPDDPHTPGEPTYINLDESTEERRPKLWRMPGGRHLAVPVFSLEEYHNHYFQRHGQWEVMWVPFPRNAGQKGAWSEMQRPVLGFGSFSTMCRVATTAYGGRGKSFGIVINPCQALTKFVSYPEMVHVAKKGVVLPHAAHLRLVDTTQWVGEVVEKSATATVEVPGPVPCLAVTELHLLLLHSTTLVKSVRVGRRQAGMFSKMLGGPTTVVTVKVCVADVTQGDAVVALLKAQWSFLSEEPSIEVAATTEVPTGVCVPGEEYELLDESYLGMIQVGTKLPGKSLKDLLDYDAPFDD